jgi:hypothetical protein
MAVVAEIGGAGASSDDKLAGFSPNLFSIVHTYLKQRIRPQKLAETRLQTRPDCVFDSRLVGWCNLPGALQLFGCHPLEVTNARMDSHLLEV